VLKALSGFFNNLIYFKVRFLYVKILANSGFNFYFIMEKYNHKKIEIKWQEVWEKTKINQTDLNSDKKKFYNLTMFPYPSAEYLHIGHMYTFSGADVYGRYKRLSGLNVFEPMGYDSFGLPAENYAIKQNTHPRQVIDNAIEHSRKQLKGSGFMFDYSREVTTSEPSYYKWTQWLFLQLYKQGLAYQKESPVNWCPKCMTVLANEQVKDGLCDRCDTEVVQKEMKQWFFKITDYADRLIQDLDKVDWPESSVTKQKNWIGRSEGVEMDMQIDGTQESFSVFTTRIDTVYGMTYVVLAPEHPLVDKVTTDGQKKEVEKYKVQAQKQTEIERQSLEKEKTGVFTGSYVINPFNGHKVPIWIADYVLYGYGTGAVMAVPAHDMRDFEFAEKYGLEIKPSILKKSSESRSFVMGISEEELKKNGVKIVEETERGFLKVTIPFNKIEDYKKLVRKTMKPKFWNEFSTDKGFYFIFKHKDGQLEELELNEKTNNLIDKYGATFNDKKPSQVPQDVYSWLSKNDFYKSLLIHTEYGILINSGEFTGLSSDEAKKKMAEWLEKRKTGKTKVNYRLHDWSIGRQRYWGAPIPIIHCSKCGVVSVSEKDLPVELPEKIKDFRPKGTGKGPLASVKEFVETTCPKCGGKAERETDTMDTFVCSSFYYMRYPSVGNDPRTISKCGASKGMMDPKITEKWLPVDMYVGGAEHVTMHLLYARFVTKALHDAKIIKFDEPFMKLRHQGMILGPDAKKMSKSKGNVVIPDAVIKEHGADAFRTYILFMARFEDGGPWDPKGIVGIKRFLEKVWTLYDKEITNNESDIEETRILNKTIKKVGEDIEEFRFNTAISQLMVFVNFLSTKKVQNKKTLEILAIMLAPFAPHMAEELWEKLGSKDSISLEIWPKYDKNLIKDETVTVAVQINGKVREQLLINVDAAEKDVLGLAKSSEKVQNYLEGKEIKKVIYIQGKLLSLVVG